MYRLLAFPASAAPNQSALLRSDPAELRDDAIGAVPVAEMSVNAGGQVEGLQEPLSAVAARLPSRALH